MQTAQRQQMRNTASAEVQNRLSRQPRAVSEQKRRSKRAFLSSDCRAEPFAEAQIQPPQSKHRRIGSLARNRAVSVVGAGHNRRQAVRAQGSFLFIGPVARKLPYLPGQAEAVPLR